MRKLGHQKHYYLMLLPGMVWLVMFSIVPMFGILMAFQNYNPGSGLFKSEWVGLENFKYMFQLNDSKTVIRNTLIIAVGKIALNLIVPLVFAILLNELRNLRYKKLVQTVVYLPHFLSWVIMSTIVIGIFGYYGVVNTIFGYFGADPQLFMADAGIFRQLIVGTDVWKEFGYNAIIYLAALTGVNPNLYEAAAIDGANRWQLIRHVTLPALITTVVLLGVLSLGNVLNAGFDQVYNLYNPLVYSTGDILDTWVYRLGLQNLQFSLATAAGLFKSVISFVLIYISYRLAYRYADYTIF
ncbi:MULTISPECIES: ABC transporter permease subunit [unclassified Paenibacillus]|uniref:ABC transporter permease n=1 Tax=unclassified Paenibacillus TaxID=185978 RepID=UPI00104834CD|nr:MULTISPECIES: ABC transporter permease subunit [unclassified Paenibacillus]NIK69028.1 putative aldouronate transport system permease protein [Paenibacillus sp. BK720]TCM86645.1 putative aldouronate transport system permease protein [Paenibacillus sp. BK033]